MKFLRIPFTLSLVVFISLLIGACSDVQNREKESSPVDTSAISLKVNARTTTEGTETTETLDPKIEKEVTKTLTKVLVGSTEQSKLFTATALTNAKETFVNNKDTKSNDVVASYDFLKNENPENEVVVVTFNENLVDSKNNKTSRKGKIYFNSSGVILGFDIENVPATFSAEEDSAS